MYQRSLNFSKEIKKFIYSTYIFFCGDRSSNLGSCIYYALSIRIELSSQGHNTDIIIHTLTNITSYSIKKGSDQWKMLEFRFIFCTELMFEYRIELL